MENIAKRLAMEEEIPRKRSRTIIHHMPCAITGKPYSEEDIEEPTVQDLCKVLGLDK